MTRFWVLIRNCDEPGAFVTRAFVYANDPHTAIAMARSMYGNLLVSAIASICTDE